MAFLASTARPFLEVHDPAAPESVHRVDTNDFSVNPRFVGSRSMPW